MNRKIIGVTIALVLAAVIGVGVYVKTQADNQAATDTNAATEGRNPNLVTSTFPEILKSGKNLTCTFSLTNDEHGITEGTMYMADQGKKIRGNFYTKPSEQAPTAPTTDMHLIVLDQANAYYWSEQGATGYRMQFDPNAGMFAGKPPQDANTEVTTQDQQYDFDCKEWSPDNALFDIPSNITFSELPTVSQPGTTPSSSESGSVNPNTSAPMMDCSVCDRVPEGEQRTACQQAIGC